MAHQETILLIQRVADKLHKFATALDTSGNEKLASKLDSLAFDLKDAIDAINKSPQPF